MAIIPLIVYPRIVYTWIYPAYLFDHLGYYKYLFFFILALCMTALLIFRFIRTREKIKFSIPFVLFLLWVIISTFFSEDLSIGIFGYPTRWQGALCYISYFILFTFTVNILEFKYIKPVIKGLFISASIISIYSIINYYGYDILSIPIKKIWGADLYPFLTRATLGNRNTGGAYFSLITLAALFLYIKNQNKKMNLILLINAILSFAGLIASLTRGSWLGVLFAVPLVIWFIKNDFKKYFKKLILITITFSTVLIIFDFTGGGIIAGRYFDFVKEIKKVEESGDVSHLGSFRLFIYKKAVKVIIDHPIVGVGPDCFAYYGTASEEEIKKNPALKRIGYFDKVHSEYLEYASTMGIPALLFYLWFIVSIFIRIMRKRGKLSAHILAVFVGWVSYLIQASVNFGAISVLPVFFVFTAILEKSLLFNESENEKMLLEQQYD